MLTLPNLLILAAFILALVETVRTSGKSPICWAVLLLSLAGLVGGVGLRL